MGLPEQKWWQKLFKGKVHAQKIDVLHDLQALQESLQDLPRELKGAGISLKELTELAREYVVASPTLQEVNLRTQGKVFETLLEKYESLQNDVDINGIRVKLLAEHWLKQVEKAGLHDLVKEKKKMPQWRMIW